MLLFFCSTHHENSLCACTSEPLIMNTVNANSAGQLSSC
ncbi:hypothetical protein SynMVIR181_02262 [Synechococcus sp. MVIR-18-1]|nr:hypothetical protein SynMVIR181_02262 [Synechococcus sp. MVIR-18-1]